LDRIAKPPQISLIIYTLSQFFEVWISIATFYSPFSPSLCCKERDRLGSVTVAIMDQETERPRSKLAKMFQWAELPERQDIYTWRGTTKWGNHDLYPIDPSERTYGALGYFAVWYAFPLSTSLSFTHSRVTHSGNGVVR
jgi:hypothetical protein